MWDKILNKVSQSHLESTKFFHECSGKTFCFILKELPNPFCFKILQSGFQKCDYTPGTPYDVQIQGDIKSYLILFANQNWPTQLETQGDLILAARLRSFLTSPHMDWEALLSQYLGGPLAHRIHLFLKQRLTEQKQIQQHWIEEIKEYLMYESKRLPTQVEFRTFCDETDALLEQSERLYARLEMQVGQ